MNFLLHHYFLAEDLLAVYFLYQLVQLDHFLHLHLQILLVNLRVHRELYYNLYHHHLHPLR
jgi:hypothetical protein